MYLIYVLSDPLDGRPRYVGITRTGLRSRFIGHRSQAERGALLPVYYWWRKLTAAGREPEMSAVEQCHDATREAFWIAYYRGQGIDLLNCTDGGAGKRGFVASAATCARLSAALKGQKRRPETCQRIAAAKKGIPRPPHVVEAVRAALKGKKKPPRSATYRANISAALRGIHRGPEFAAKVSAATRGKKKPPRTAAHRAKLAESSRRAGVSAACRTALGERNRQAPPGAKLTPERVREVRCAYAAGGATYDDLAARFALCPETIGKMVRRETWIHVN